MSAAASQSDRLNQRVQTAVSRYSRAPLGQRGRLLMPFKRELRPSLYSVELRTTRWQQMVEWYRSVLGLRVLVRVVDDGYALIEAGETRLALISRPSNGEPSGRWSLGFEVYDLEQAAARLEAAGSRYTQPRRHAEGFQEIVTTDPDGNSIRLFAWPEQE
jgi:catechol 2,3-dioxygenase-like lactoylglutathione lyase family enzyme